MANSAMDTLRGLLGDNADEKIKAALDTLSSSGNQQSIIPTSDSLSQQSSANFGSIDSGTLDSLMQIRDIISRITDSGSDSRANLLLSLKPYMRTARQGSIDTAVRMLNISKLSGLFRLR